MGMRYDKVAEAWRLDYPCRIGGRATHLKDTVYGPRREMQAAAMRRWLELEEQINDPDRSLKFETDITQYLSSHVLQPNITRIINAVRAGLGNVKLNELQKAGEEWIRQQECRVSKKTKKRLSPATLQCYKRYIKAILSYCGHSEHWPEIKIGRSIVRRRPIDIDEMIRLEDAVMGLYPWFYPAFDFARTCPIRPEDQFLLSVKHVSVDKVPIEVKYQPKKTGTWAYPIIQPHQESYFRSKEDLIFCRPDGSSLYTASSSYYDFIWGKVCAAANVEGLRYYDLRHNAVALLRSQGVEDWRIVKAAGWAGPEMLKVYDPDNEHLIREYDRRFAHSCSTDVAPEPQLSSNVIEGVECGE